MKLRNQMLTLSLATVLVPWFGFKLVQELEQYLRAGQENALRGSARTMARALPVVHQTELLGRDSILPSRNLTSAPIIDGYANDWPEPQSSQRFDSRDDGSDEPALYVLAGRHGGTDYLFLWVRDSTPRREEPPDEASADSVLLFLRNERGLVQYRIRTAAPGPLLIDSQTAGGGQLRGHWIERDGGYQLELVLPRSSRVSSLSLGVQDVYRDRFGVDRIREAGTLVDGRPVEWMTSMPPSGELTRWLHDVAPKSARAWLVDRRGWVIADTGLGANSGTRDPSWVERAIYKLVVRDHMAAQSEREDTMVRFSDPLTLEALEGNSVSQWSGDPETAEIRNTVGEPLLVGDRLLGAVILEADTDGALLFTNRTLGRLLLVSGVLTLALVLGLWLLATRLSRRVQSLSGAVSLAMDDAAQPGNLPMIEDRDELGELARNNARLLRAVADYTAYLQKLAGRLSHELKTPLAITRSSLDNLSAQPLDEEASRYLARAREGLDRQAAIVRAMSEASRLEAAVKAADWEEVDLSEVIRSCVEAYRGVHQNRQIELELPEANAMIRCAPDLLAQALDKLVDNAVSLTDSREMISVALVPDGNRYLLRVTNSGSTLPDTLQDQLFDSLVSVREPGGDSMHLGLGLHIVRLVAEAHGGAVVARNLPGGQGVVFEIAIPVERRV